MDLDSGFRRNPEKWLHGQSAELIENLQKEELFSKPLGHFEIGSEEWFQSMGMVSYLVGRSVDARQSLLEKKLASQRDGTILQLVPTRGRVMELETDPSFWLRVKVDTLTGVIYRIFEENIRFEQFRDYTPIDDAHRSLLVKKILESRNIEPDGLTYFSRLLKGSHKETDFPGIYRAISRFFSQLVKNNFQDNFAQDLAGRIVRLEEGSPGKGEETYALESDLTWLFGDYEEIKREIKGYDESDVLSSVKSFLREGCTPYILNGVRVIVFDGFIHISRIEEDILFLLFKRVDEVWWLLDYDSRKKDVISEFKVSSGREAMWHWGGKDRERELRTGILEAYRINAPFVSLIERLDNAGIDSRIERSSEAPFPNPVAGSLYLGGKTVEINGNSLKIRSFAGRADEVRAIAREIKLILGKQGLYASRDLGKIRVIFPDLNDYSSLIFEIFGEYGLPFSLTKGLPLSAHPTSNLFLHVFEVSLNHLNREDIFRLFSSNLVKVNYSRVFSESPEEKFLDLIKDHLLEGDNISEVEKLLIGKSNERTSNELDIFLFDRVSRKFGVSIRGEDLSDLGGISIQWFRDYYQERYQKVRDSKERDRLRLEYYGFLRQVGLVKRLMGPFKELTRQSDPFGLERLFFKILEILGFPGNILDVPKSLNRLDSGTLKLMVKRDIKAYSLLRDLVTASASELRFEKKLFEIRSSYDLLSRFDAIFRYRLNNAYLHDERNPNVIRISQWLETRGRSFDYIFAGGMTADRFPLKDEVNFILPESPSSRFRLLDPIDQSRHLFSHILRNYRKRLYISFPKYTDERETQPSQVLIDLASMVKIRASSDTGMIEHLFKWEDTSHFLSKEELLNAQRLEDTAPDSTECSPFPLKRIILGDESRAEDLVRGINALISRWTSDGIFEYDGLVNGSAKFYEYLKTRDDIFSPSQLDTLANCPMRYLFEHIYGLEPMEEHGPEISPRDMGVHLHAILNIFFNRLGAEGKNVADISLGRAFSLAMETADDYLRNQSLLNRFEFFESQKRELLEGLDQDRTTLEGDQKKREGILAQLIRFEDREFGGRIPKGLEYAFGHKETSSVLLGKVRIQGYIDRFDIDKENPETAHIYDYKSGRIPSSNVIKKGLSFQLPAYIRAIRSRLKFKKISAAFYALKRDILLKESPLKQTIIDQVHGMRGLDISGVRLIDDFSDQLIELLERGYFHHSTDELICYYCKFSHACHKDMRRMTHIIDSGADKRIYSGKRNFDEWNRVDEFRKEWKVVSQSMQKAFSLRTESGRKKHFESVLRFRNTLSETRDSLPFHAEYIDALLQELADFEKRYLTS